MLDIQKFLGKPEICWLKNNDTRVSSFRFGPLPAGIGHSIGNLIRRTLLAYAPGISITAINIKGVSHEYSSIDGVKDTVLQIMLNFKDLKFNGNIVEKNRIQWMTKKFKGVGIYTSNDLDLPSGVELLTNDLYLFEITDPKVEIELSYRLEKGYKYMSIDDLKKREDDFMDSGSGSQIGTILIDNSFTLVSNVSYNVEEVISDFNGDYNDYLTIDIETVSDNIDPKELLSFAGEVVSSYTRMFIFDESYIDISLLSDLDSIEDNKKQEHIELKDVKKTPIDSLPTLSERTRNALIKNQIEFVEDLEKRTRTELISLKGVGKKAVDEIQEALDKEGRQLGVKK